MDYIKHIDGFWNTTEYKYKDRKVLIKSQNGKGMKAHCFYPNSDKVEFTLRYRFILPKQLLEKVKLKINKNENTK